MPATIVFLIGSLDRGGTEGQLIELAARLPRAQFAPEIWCLAKPGERADEARQRGVPVRVFGFQTRHGFLRTLLRLTWALWKAKPAIVHGFLFEAYIAAGLCGALARVPGRIASRRSLGIFKENRPLALWVERLATHYTHAIVCNSQAVLRDTALREPWAEEKLLLISNGVDTARFCPAMRLAGQIPFVVSVANLIPYKRVDRFLHIARRLQDISPGCYRFWIIGDGPCREALHRLCSTLKLDGVTTFFGRVANVERLISERTDILVHTADQEGFPNAILEAMACGLPVVASAVGGIPELVEDGVTGYIVKDRGDIACWASCVEDLLHHPENRLQFSLRARAKAETFSVTAMVEEYASLYEAFLDEC